MEFNEPNWIKLIFLLADTQQWLTEMSTTALQQVPLEYKQKLKTYYLSITALAHILEKHYYKIPRHPGTGKFHLPVTGILLYIREAGSITPTSVPGCLNFKRVIKTDEAVGFDSNGEAAYCITVITDAGGGIVTAFPGVISQAGSLKEH